MRHHKLAFIDTETTGFDPDTHELIEIGIILVDQDWTKGKPVFTVIEEFEIKIKPVHIETADPISLKINKYNAEDWGNAYALKEAMKILNTKIKDSIMVAHNMYFDATFIDRAYKQTGVKNEMHYLRIDTITMAFAKLHDRTDIDKYSLRTLCEYFKIENKNAHSALSDTKALFELYKHLINI
ncbi:MAG: polymerase subunit epsilon [Patescibacteria group bacterium]|jgi:DNA polymerase III epsilon subunit-like protein|nr:polymerase subunit epsilon [Patescibacteria group bacterium]